MSFGVSPVNYSDKVILNITFAVLTYFKSYLPENFKTF